MIKEHCEKLIQVYESQIELIKIIHKYFHDTDVKLAWLPNPQTTRLDEFAKRERELRMMLGYDASEEVMSRVSDVQEKLRALNA